MPSDADWQDWTLTMDELLAVAWSWLLLTAAVTLLPHALLWGVPWPASGATVWESLGRWLWDLFLLGLVYVASIPLHEGLHALAMRLAGGVPWRSISFGARWHEGAVYVHTDAPMTVRAYRIVLATPALVLGLLPAAAGLATGSGWLTVYGWIMLASALGDVAMLRHLRPLPPDALVRDHPEAVGCQVKRSPGRAG